MMGWWRRYQDWKRRKNLIRHLSPEVREQAAKLFSDCDRIIREIEAEYGRR